MRLYKLMALMHRDFLIFMRSKWRIMEFFYFPLSTTIIWGLFAIYTQSFAMGTGLMVLAINIFWSFCYVNQSTTNLQMCEDTWSGSLRQILASGVSEFEYIGARIVSSTVISLLVLCTMFGFAYAFGLTILFEEFGVVISLIGIALIASIAMSVLIGALIIFFGRGYAFLAWTVLQVFILLSAPFYPLEILPGVVHKVALVMPFTQIFAAVRSLISTGYIPFELLSAGLVTALAYLALSIPFYFFAFKRARKMGQLVKIS